VKSLICSDENPYNQHCFQQSLQSLTGDRKDKATYVPLSATAMMSEKSSSKRLRQDCRVLIVDPPRKGLDSAVLDFLVQNKNYHNVELLVYVSCGFDAFRRDCTRLTEGDSTSNQEQRLWNLEHAEGHILFPGSNAIETLAYFTPAM